MKRAVITVVFTSLAMLSMAATNFVQTAVPEGPHQVQVSGDWTVTLKIVIATGGVVLPAAFTLGVIFTRLTETLRQNTVSLQQTSERLSKGDERFRAIEAKIDELSNVLNLIPCTAHDHTCPDKRRK